ncbi:hypothetical protein FQR65_LT19402 [Abscondita terminalis]|nr:hypothetical protein FQR65_LT19402 [Abscondita terminalis]
MYLLAGVVGAVAAGVGYFMGRESERSHVTARPFMWYDEQVPNYTDTDTVCAICLDELSPSKVFTMQTQIMKADFNKWLQIQKTCPK